jgi:putative nucleotidyltransferase with HDIG domain
MTYVLAILALMGILGIAYHLFLRKPAADPVSNGDSVAAQIKTTTPERDAFTSKWERVLSDALDHIYSPDPTVAETSSPSVIDEPPAATAAAMATLIKAFEKVGTLHSSLAALDKPDVSMKDLGDLVTRDPLLSARVLKTVNSPLFRTAVDIKSVHTAVNILGLVNLKNLMAFGILPYTLYRNPEHRRIFQNVWQHMNATAITAVHMARARQDMDSGTLYTAGLLHDIGKLVLILLMKDPQENEPYPHNLNLECDRLTATHLQAAQAIASSGGIPAQLRSLVLDHHLPAMLPVQQLNCDAVHARNLTLLFLANQVAKVITQDGTLTDDMSLLDRLDPSYVEIISKAEAREILLCPGLIEDILANVRVVQITLS